MTRITILEQKLVQLQEKLGLSNSIRRDIESQRVDQLSRVIHEYFEEVLEEGDTIKVSGDRVEFTRPQEGYSYNKELLNLYFRQKDWRDEVVDEIQTSFYSTSDNSEYELRRMILIGKVGQIVLDFYDDVLGAYNKVISQFEDALTHQFKEIYGLEKEIREVNKQIKLIEKENLLNKVESEGIEFQLPEGKSVNELPNIDVKFDRTVYNVKGIKIIKKTTSGKSADIGLKLLQNVWDPNTSSYNVKEEQRVVSRVRMSNVEQFLQYNSDRISAS
jgi:hypothetical protein